MAQNAIEKLTVSEGLAQQLLGAAADKAREISAPMSIAVVDEGANLKAFIRMDGAPLISQEISVEKAQTVAKFPMPTHEFWNFIKEDPMLKTGLGNAPGISVLGGGFPLFWKDQLIGGLGVSGGHYTQDMECAEAALALLK